MNRDICAQIDERLVELFDKIPDAASKTPEEFFSEVFSTEAVSRERLGRNTQGRSFVNNIIASTLPEADEMVFAIIKLVVSAERRYLDRLINSAGNIVADACKSGRYEERIPLVLHTGSGRGRLTEVDHQRNLLIFGTNSEDLPRLKEFFKTWRSVGKEKSLVDYCIEEASKPGKANKFNPNVWNVLTEMFPEKALNQNSAWFNPNTAIGAYIIGGANKLAEVLGTTAGRASLTEVDANGKLKIFGSNYEFLYRNVRFRIDGLDVVDLEGFFRRWRSETQESKSLLDYCVAAATRKENPVKFHPSVWHLLRRVFVAQFAEIDLGYDADEARECHPGDSVDYDSVEVLNTFTEDSVQMNEGDFNTVEGQLKAFALDKNGKTPLQLAAEKDDHELVRRIIDGDLSSKAVYINSGNLLQNAGERSLGILVYQLQRFLLNNIKPTGNGWSPSVFLTGANPNLLRAIINSFGLKVMENLNPLVREAHINVLKIFIENPLYKDKVLAKILEVVPSLLTNDSRTVVLKLFKFVKENYTVAEQEKFVAVQTNNNITPFHVAADFGDMEVIQAMYATDAGKKAAKVISEYGTPLLFAMRKGKGNLAAIEELLKYPEVQETLESTYSHTKNIFHPYNRTAIDPEVLRLVLRTFPRMVKLLDQRDAVGEMPISSFKSEHLQVLVELVREVEGFTLPSGCIPFLVNRFLVDGNAGLMPIITAFAEGRAALSNFDAQEVLPLRRAIYSGNLDTVKNLLSCDEVKNTMLLRNKNGETIFHSLSHYQNFQIKPEILSYILENYPESRQLLLQTQHGVSPLQKFNVEQLKIAFSYLTKEEVEQLLLSTKGAQHNLVQAALLKVVSYSGGAHDATKEKAEYLLGVMDECSDNLDAKKAVFTTVEDNRRFIDTLLEDVKKLIPIKFLTLELEDGVLAALFGLIKCAATEEQASAVLNNPDENGLSLRQRISPEQRAVLDLAFVASPALNSALATTTVAPALTTEHVGGTSLQSVNSSTVAAVAVSTTTAQFRKRSSAEELRDGVKSHRTGDVDFIEL